jgi:hypothetical protein
LRISKSLILGLILFISFTAQAQASEEMETEGGYEKVVDGYEVKLAFEGGEAQTGRNKVHLKLEDAKGKPVGNSKVTLTATHEESNKRIEMELKTGHVADESLGGAIMKLLLPGSRLSSGGLKSGEYGGELEFAETGTWMIGVTFVVQGKERTAEFEANVSQGGINWYVLWGFLIVNCVIIITVAVIKRNILNRPVEPMLKESSA